MDKRKIPFLSIVLYVLAGLLVLYTIWGLLYCRDYIAKAVTAGQLVVKGNEYQVINFYMTTAGQYFLSAVIFTALGCLLQKLSFFRRDEVDGTEPAASPVIPRDEENDDDL